MDRNWMYARRNTNEYEQGVEEFIAFAIKHVEDVNQILCPCVDCNNMIRLRVEALRDHLMVKGINQMYKCWIHHGESLGDAPSNVHGTTSFETKMRDEMKEDIAYEDDGLEEMAQAMENNLEDTPEMFESLCSDAKKPLYPGCTKYSRLSVVINLFNLKASNGWTDKSFTDLLKILQDMLPSENLLPSRTYEAKKMLSSIGMSHEKIHACPNDCILYRKEYSTLENCPECNAPRYTKNKVPAKVMWYFPIVPRFKRLFSIKEDAKNTTWHADERKTDGMLRHPADSPQWVKIDRDYHDFGKEPRNLRLALATDGMNPHSNQRSTHSTWPVILMNYNLPPSLIMKRKYMMLSMLISGPKQPGHDIDVYLAPLIEDLQMMWESGVDVYDAYRNEIFNLRALLFGTINDFPAYGNLSGYTVKGYQACPICQEHTSSYKLKNSGKDGENKRKNSGKIVYPGHRIFLPLKHHYRRWRKAFDGKTEDRKSSIPISGRQIFKKVKSLNVKHGKLNAKDVPKRGFKKESIFFKLPYWENLHVRHFLDVMHIEKNVCESLVGTLLNIPGKSKDSINARKDLVDLGIRTELHPVKDGDRTYLPPACYTLSRKEKKLFCECLHGVKVPDGYSSNFKNLVSLKENKLLGLKSHDYHVLMEHLLPISIRSILPERVRDAITRLCIFFSEICRKEIDPMKLSNLQKDVVVTLCQLEMYFPPSFFDIMVHLTVHLVREIQLCGPAYLRYMYPIERYMKILKFYVKSASRPEGCIVERYLIEEAIEFCSHYLSNVDAIGIPKPRHSSGLAGKGITGKKLLTISDDMWHQAHLHVLHNSPEIDAYAEEHKESLRNHYPNKNEKWIIKKHNSSFIEWLKIRIGDEIARSPSNVSERLKWLSRGPSKNVFSYSGYQINGFTFCTKDRDNETTTQNSGVTIVAQAMHISSAKDNNPIYAKMSYYGVIENIWELDYISFRVPIFGCKWADNNNGVRFDEKHGFTFVDLNRVGSKDDVFILAAQANQVFFVTDPADHRWSFVLSTNRRYPLEDYEINDMEEPSFVLPSQPLDDEAPEDDFYKRDDHGVGIWVDGEDPNTTTIHKKKRKRT